eukprot:TRINITY_DN3298_c0_g1_i3.p1 TRINITY_DN3298_c0_g1~~TRINITY_DN3298_c0_g1_i3.p1  ORF type:complete len:106 (+),score=27.05 TRINITY_DN3298_c0_g1_i3:51-368(+)
MIRGLLQRSGSICMASSGARMNALRIISNSGSRSFSNISTSSFTSSSITSSQQAPPPLGPSSSPFSSIQNSSTSGLSLLSGKIAFGGSGFVIALDGEDEDDDDGT